MTKETIELLEFSSIRYESLSEAGELSACKLRTLLASNCGVEGTNADRRSSYG